MLVIKLCPVAGEIVGERLAAAWGRRVALESGLRATHSPPKGLHGLLSPQPAFAAGADVALLARSLSES